jgi:predicted protein tyrosine phosphatase
MPWIQNVSLADIVKGCHFFEEHKTVLIQIQDVCTWKFAEPLYKDKFVEVHQLEFMDNDDPDDDANITEEQAEKIATILTSAKDRGYNIVVHCHAGLCRSGAVTEVGVLMGFDDTEMIRHPNILVKNRLKTALGMQVDYNEVFKTYLDLDNDY